MIKDAEAHADEDRTRREEAEVRNQAETLVYQTEKFVKEQRESRGRLKVPEDTLNKVDAAVAEAKAALKGTDIAAIKAAMEKLGHGVPGARSGDLRGDSGGRRCRRLAAGGAAPARPTTSWTRRWSTRTTGRPSDRRKRETDGTQEPVTRHRQAADRSRDRRSTARPSRLRAGRRGCVGSREPRLPTDGRTRSPSCTARSAAGTGRVRQLPQAGAARPAGARRTGPRPVSSANCWPCSTISIARASTAIWKPAR